MSHVVSQPIPPFAIAGGALEVHQIPAATNNYVWLIVAHDRSGAAVVDGPDAAGALAVCERLQIPLVSVFNTHTHHDHIGLNRDLEARGLLRTMRVVGPAKVQGDVPGITEPVDEGDSIELFGVRAQVWLTEGHLDGHISFVFPGAVFCGDTMFGAGCGYLFDGPPSTMYASLQRLAALPGDTRVCCAHEYTEDNLRFAWSVDAKNPELATRIRWAWNKRAAGGATVPSTIAEERATNPFLRQHDAALCAAVARETPGLDVRDASAVFAATRALKDRKLYKDHPDSSLPL
jgi:hydroxyacylglutathione hydrolase